MLESRGASSLGSFTFEGHVRSLNVLWEHFPCLPIILSTNCKVDLTLLGVFKGRAFFNPQLSQTDGEGHDQSLPLVHLLGLQNPSTCVL